MKSLMEYRSIVLSGRKNRRDPERPGASGLYQEPRVDLMVRARPDPGPGGLVLEVITASICGTDIHALQTDKDGYSCSSVPAREWEHGIQFGHEMAGRVVGIGPAVAGCKIGDMVTIDSLVPCRRTECNACAAQHWNYCSDAFLIGLQANGTFGEYALAPAASAHPITPLLRRYSFDLAVQVAALAEPLGVALHAIHQARRWLSEKSPSALVMGAGPIGMFLAWQARTNGFDPVVVLEPNPKRCSRAREFAHMAMHPDDYDIQVAQDVFGNGPSVVFDACGADLGPIVDTIAPGGAIVTIARTGRTMRLSNDSLITRGIAVIGSRGHVGHVPLALERLATFDGEPETFLTRVLNGLDELLAALRDPGAFPDEFKVVCRIS